MPGLFDMHAHVAGITKDTPYNETESENTLKMLLDHGVTTIRNPGGPTAESISLKHNVSNGSIEGPEIFTAGRLINSPQIPIDNRVGTIEAGKEADMIILDANPVDN